MAVGQTIIYTEIYASNHEQLGTWYKKVFGWRLESFPDMNFTIGSAADDPGGGVGFIEASNGMQPGQVIPYIFSSDIEADVRKLAENGATVYESMDIPGGGRWSHFKDPDGNVLALMQPAMPG